MSFNLDCVAPDGDWITERSDFPTVEAAWARSGDMGSRWFFYPVHVVTAGKSHVIRGVPQGMPEDWVGRKLTSLAEMIKGHQGHVTAYIKGECPFEPRPGDTEQFYGDTVSEDVAAADLLAGCERRAIELYYAAPPGKLAGDCRRELVEEFGETVVTQVMAKGLGNNGRLSPVSDKADTIDASEPIHDFFGLSYASYLVLPRTLLQSCSRETQVALVAALERVREEECANRREYWPDNDQCDAEIVVKLKDSATGRFIKDDLADYQRGRRRLW